VYSNEKINDEVYDVYHYTPFPKNVMKVQTV